LGDVLTLATPRTDDPLNGVQIPVSGKPHPNQSQPSVIEKIHARKVSQLPVRNDQGTYEHTPPDLSSTESIGDYIQARTAAWSQHLQRVRQRRAGTGSATPKASTKAISREAVRKAPKKRR